MPGPDAGDRRSTPLEPGLLSRMHRGRMRHDRRLETVVLVLVALAAASLALVLVRGPALAGVGAGAARLSAALFAAAVISGLAHLGISRRLAVERSAALWSVELEERLEARSGGGRFRLPEEADEDEVLERLEDDFDVDPDELPLRKDRDQLRVLYRELARQEVEAERGRIRAFAGTFLPGGAEALGDPLDPSGEDGGFGRRRRLLARWRARCYRAVAGLYAGGVAVLLGAHLMG